MTTTGTRVVLDWNRLPTTEEIATVYDWLDPWTARHFRSAEGIQIEWLADPVSRHSVTGLTSHRTRTISGVVVRWKCPFILPAPVLIIVQLVAGGLTDGEGSAFVDQLYFQSEVTPEQLRQILDLHQPGALPAWARFEL